MNNVLIFAGGTGTRMNSKGKPKQFLELHGKPIIIYTIEKYDKCKEIDNIVVVCHRDWIEYLNMLLKKFMIRKVSTVLAGGSTGQESIRKGIFYLYENSQSDQDIVLIHDGVRPLIDEETIQKNIAFVKKYGNCITTAPVTETIVRADEKKDVEQIFEIYDRQHCRVARAPQSFYLKDVYLKHKKLVEEGDPMMVDTAMLMDYYGVKLFMVEGPIENIKITTPMDFYIFRAIIDAQENSQIWGM